MQACSCSHVHMLLCLDPHSILAGLHKHEASFTELALGFFTFTYEIMMARMP